MSMMAGSGRRLLLRKDTPACPELHFVDLRVLRGSWFFCSFAVNPRAPLWCKTFPPIGKKTEAKTVDGKELIQEPEPIRNVR